MIEIWNAVIPVVNVIVAGMISWALAMAGKWIAKKTDNEWVTGAFHRFQTAVTLAVSEVQQTYVKSIKAAAADGKLTDEEKKKALELAMNAAKSYLGPKGVQEILNVLGVQEHFLDGYLKGNIEAAISDRKELMVPPTSARSESPEE